jgi:hypothetical protein
MTARPKIWSWAAGLAVLAAMLIPPQAQAQSSNDGLALGLSLWGGYVFPSNKTHGSHPAGGGVLYLRFSRQVVLEIEGVFSAIPTESQSLGLSQGRLFHIPLVLNIRYRLPLAKSPLAFFLTAGGGYAFNIMQLDADMVKNFSTLGFEVSETCRAAALFQAGAGLEVLLSPRLALEAFGLYRISEASGEWSITDTVLGTRTSGTIDKVDLSAAVAGLGLRFIF